jgi:hypothetical protein
MGTKKSTVKKSEFEKPEVVAAEIVAEGGLAKPNRKVRTWRISTGVYQVEFVGVKKIGTVVVCFPPKSKPRHCVAWIRRLPLHRAKKPDLQRAEITIRNPKGVLVDHEFGVMAISTPFFSNQPDVAE